PRSGNLVGPEELKRFVREARSDAQLRHPGITSVHEVGTSDSGPFLVSAFVEGVTLTDWLSAHRPTFAQSAELVIQAADAVRYALQPGVFHRDIKPSTIMLELVSVEDGADRSAIARHLSPLARGPRPASQYSLKLMDFGLAKRGADEVTMTVDGQVLG